jgi:hypothetical protein
VEADNPEIAKLMPGYFKKLAQETQASEMQGKINKLSVEKLGLADSFLRQIGQELQRRDRTRKIERHLQQKYQREFSPDELRKILKGKEEAFMEDTAELKAISGKKYTPDQVKEIIGKYESYAGIPTEQEYPGSQKENKGFYGQLLSQRQKTVAAIKTITGEEIEATALHLGEIDLQQALAAETQIREGNYDGDQFASYTAQRFIDLFADERSKIANELGKFESESGKQREVLYGYITKTKESANARMTGGVCVSGDNPDLSQDTPNMWDMENYFQQVYQNPESFECEGVTLLHRIEDNGKKILSASFNPSSTYLYSVDEEAAFRGMAGKLAQFAQDNNFDYIAVSQNQTIRTNRTGGKFESAMNEQIAAVGKSLRLSTPQQFSFKPNYQIQEMDILWENSSGNQSPENLTQAV